MLKKLFTLIALLTMLNAFAALEINNASEAELDSLNGVGPDMSRKILDERKKAPFKDWSDVMTRVKGIGKAKAAKFSREGVTVSGKLFEPQGSPASTPTLTTP